MADHDKKQDDQQEKKDNNKQNDQQQDSKSKEDKEKELEDLLKQLKELQQEREKLGQKQTPRQRMIMIEFGAIFHKNGIVNFLMYFMMNLLVIYSLSELIALVDFNGRLMDLIAFMAVYTFIDIMYRQYLVKHHFKLVLRTFGFIFFFGYLTFFYFLEQYLFDGIFTFENETFFVIFIITFVLVRYALSHVIRHFILRVMRW